MHAQRMPPHITTPFDDSAAMRLRRMGLLTPDGTPDERIIQPLAYVSAGLYYDQLCDSVESHESASGVCQHLHDSVYAACPLTAAAQSPDTAQTAPQNRSASHF